MRKVKQLILLGFSLPNSGEIRENIVVEARKNWCSRRDLNSHSHKAEGF